MIERRLVFIAVLALAACSASDPATPAPAIVKTMKDPGAGKVAISRGAVLIDVRTPDEFAAGHLANATNIPVDEVATRLAEVAKLTNNDLAIPIVLNCGTGQRAGRAQLTLAAAGYTSVVNGGGLRDLQQ